MVMTSLLERGNSLSHMTGTAFGNTWNKNIPSKYLTPFAWIVCRTKNTLRCQARPPYAVMVVHVMDFSSSFSCLHAPFIFVVIMIPNTNKLDS